MRQLDECGRAVDSRLGRPRPVRRSRRRYRSCSCCSPRWRSRTDAGPGVHRSCSSQHEHHDSGARQTRSARIWRLSVGGLFGGVARCRRTWFPAKQGGLHLRLASLRALRCRLCGSLDVGGWTRCVRTCEPASTETPTERGSVSGVKGCASGAGIDRVGGRRRAVALARHDREYEGLSIRQIADRLGRSPATVKAYF